MKNQTPIVQQSTEQLLGAPGNEVQKSILSDQDTEMAQSSCRNSLTLSAFIDANEGHAKSFLIAASDDLAAE